MPIRRRGFVVALALIVVGVGLLRAASAEDGPPKRILFIGNSYTRGIQPGIEFFFKEARADLQMQFITPGGRRLSQHAANEATLRTIRTGDWDLVVLQEQSQLPSLPGLEEEFLRAGVQLDAAIRKAGGSSMLFETWGRRDGDKANRQVNPDFATMQKRLTAAYAKLGERTETPVAPIGQAWAIVQEQSPELFKKLYTGDGSHPSLHGAYLSGAVIYAQVTGADPREITTQPRGINRADAAKLRAAAHTAVAP